MAIALMAEARRLYKLEERIQQDRYDRNHGERELADRLAQWATQARQLGVTYVTTLEAFAEQAQRMEERIANVEEGYDTTAGALRNAMDKLARVRELCDGKLGSLYDEDTQFMAREVLGALDG